MLTRTQADKEAPVKRIPSNRHGCGFGVCGQQEPHHLNMFKRTQHDQKAPVKRIPSNGHGCGFGQCGKREQYQLTMLTRTEIGKKYPVKRMPSNGCGFRDCEQREHYQLKPQDQVNINDRNMPSEDCVSGNCNTKKTENNELVILTPCGKNVCEVTKPPREPKSRITDVQIKRKPETTTRGEKQLAKARRAPFPCGNGMCTRTAFIA